MILVRTNQSVPPAAYHAAAYQARVAKLQAELAQAPAARKPEIQARLRRLEWVVR